MCKCLPLLILSLIFANCQREQQEAKNIVTTDVTNFWEAYDKITSTQDSTLQYEYLDSLYLRKGTAGLKAIMQARNYTPQDYIRAINDYPTFWASVRENTLKTDQFTPKLAAGIEQLRVLYPDLKPAKIFFTIGALRTNGTTTDSLVLIGSELAMTDTNTVTNEFPEPSKEAFRLFFDSNPINDLVLLNIHEFVHTQQKPMVHNLLSQVIYEGVAEFVSTKALDVPSAAPAIAYGKQNADRVRAQFEREMFYPNNTPKWLWSNAPNDFGVRDLGYYIGYQLCENYYELAAHKEEAIKTLIELDYANESEIENFVQATGFFSASLDTLYERFEEKRPFVTGVKEFENHSENVDPNTTQITVKFSRPLNGYNTGVDYGDLGEEAFPKVLTRSWATDNRSWTMTVELVPNTVYQLLISNNFRSEDNRPLKPYLVSFKTAPK